MASLRIQSMCVNFPSMLSEINGLVHYKDATDNLV